MIIYKLNTRKKAFTMIELVFVIVVMGILAAVALPRIDRDLLIEAQDGILSDIRYTQHLALNDFKYSDTNASWQKALWRIGFNNCASSTGIYEYIGSDTDYGGGIGNDEAAIDPANGHKMTWSGATCTNGGDSNTSDRIFLSKKYGITNVATAGGCANRQYIGFDHLGRLHGGFAGTMGSATPDYASYTNTQCTITFTMSDGETFDVTIQPESGYAEIANYVGS